MFKLLRFDVFIASISYLRTYRAAMLILFSLQLRHVYSAMSSRSTIQFIHLIFLSQPPIKSFANIL